MGWKLLFSLLILTTPIIELNAQSVNTEFGKNRVQYHDDFNKWWMYETENFITYWYGKGKNVAHSVVQMAEYDHNEIQNVIEHRINDKIQIVVYTDLSDLKQSNNGSEETFEGEEKVTKVIGSKMFVYFDGNHQNLRKQIRKGIAEVYLTSLFSGSSLQEIVKSSINLKVPNWFSEGLISYLTSYWDHLVDDELRDLWGRKNRDYTNFSRLSNDFPKIAGHSFWYYIDQQFGRSTISNLLYLSRLNSKFESSFLFVLGVPFEKIINDWFIYYNNYYSEEKQVFNSPSARNLLQLSNKKHAPVSELLLSPDGNSLIYTHNNLGKYEVVLRNLTSDDEKVLFKYGYKNILQEADYNFPMTTWHPSGLEVTIMYEHRDLIYLRKINLKSKEYIEQVLPENFQRVYSLDYINDLDYLFSANTDGYSDLYIYRSKNRQTIRLTEDFWDDLDASYITLEGKEGILFSSNRRSTTLKNESLDTILPIDDFDIYFLSTKDSDQELIQLTNTQNENERYPILSNGSYLCFVNSTAGITNRHLVNLNEDREQYPNSNYSRNIIRHGASDGSDAYVFTYYENGAYASYIEFPDWDQHISPYSTGLIKKQKSMVSASSPSTFGVLQLEKKNIEWNPGYQFQSEFDDPAKLEPLGTHQTREDTDLLNPFSIDFQGENSSRKLVEFVNARAVASRTSFKLEDFTTRLDNEILFEGLESFAGQDMEFLTAPVGILIKTKFKDLFEDYQIEAGVRIPTAFNGSEYFLVVDNNKKLIDKRFALYRKSLSERDEGTIFPTQKTKRTTLLGLFRAKYPLDVYRSLRGTTSLRFDKYFYLNSDEFSSSQPINHEKRISIKLEYVFDNTLDLDINLRQGSRYKVYLEAINRFDLQINDGFKLKPSEGFTTVLGFDARHYIPFLKHSILAFRGAGATSFGNEKIIYYLGGVEGNIFPKFNQDIPVPPNETFSYKTIAANLRGFDHNIRNGTSFLLGNAEIRIPIFKYLKKTQLRSKFLRSVQLIGFYDVGTSWHGLTPNSEDNPINSATIEQPPVIRIKIRYYRDPLVMGYGTGIRAGFLGYFIRIDYAWGIESRSTLDPKIHFAIGKDF